MAAVGAAAVVGVVGADPGSPALMATVSGCASTTAALVSGALWLRAGRWASGRAKLGLRLLGVAMFGWAAGDAVWVGDYLVNGGDDPTIPPLANVGFTVTMLLGPLSVALLFGSRRVARVRTVLDALLIGTALLYIAWAAALGPMYRAQGGGLGALTSLSYPLADVVIATMVLILVRDAVPAIRTSAELAATGLILMFIGDGGYAYLSVQGTYQPGHLADLGWFLGFVVVAVGAPRRHELAGTAVLTDDQPRRLFLPYVPFLLAFGTAVTLFVTRRGQVEPAQYALSMVVVFLIVVRQIVTLNDNRTLTRQLEGAVDDLRYRAYHDPLTGLANRHMLMEAVERALAPETGAQLAVLYIDLDGFKPINDALGHAAGDRVLVVVADRLTGAARSDDVVARLGGDEFAVLLPELQHSADAQAVASRIQAALQSGIDLDGHPVRVGASIGVAYGQAGRIGLGELLRNADVAMYTAKVQGRSRTVVFEPELLSRLPLDQAS
ncbi:GGDEF domain-containing protein [Planosporangium flavigriseum]|uniref:GGDEF domain-containing protein n=1 Tax=Planosporangium flavigriseum TaxID=373681 RepID=UPI001439F2B7|nr:GGDEF domain-containing protein [Planosporangium flavigriseum]NJC66086.1 GGDEF domain-containing protein [Planosporangium flavigriseum]